MRKTFLLVALAGSVLLGASHAALAIERHKTSHYPSADYGSWHGNYYHVQWGAPVALVVPPTVHTQTDYHWGVPSMRVSGIAQQFRRGGAGGIYGGNFSPPPYWPYDTQQFGVYYVRGPW